MFLPFERGRRRSVHPVTLAKPPVSDTSRTTTDTFAYTTVGSRCRSGLCPLSQTQPTRKTQSTSSMQRSKQRYSPIVTIGMRTERLGERITARGVNQYRSRNAFSIHTFEEFRHSLGACRKPVVNLPYECFKFHQRTPLRWIGEFDEINHVVVFENHCEMRRGKAIR